MRGMPVAKPSHDWFIFFPCIVDPWLDMIFELNFAGLGLG